MNFDSKKWWTEKLFIQHQSINVVHPNEETDFMIPNHEMKGDYYVNPFLSELINEF